jgi:hypothetical protein
MILGIFKKNGRLAAQTRKSAKIQGDPPKLPDHPTVQFKQIHPPIQTINSSTHRPTLKQQKTL